MVPHKRAEMCPSVSHFHWVIYKRNQCIFFVSNLGFILCTPLCVWRGFSLTRATADAGWCKVMDKISTMKRRDRPEKMAEHFRGFGIIITWNKVKPVSTAADWAATIAQCQCVLHVPGTHSTQCYVSITAGGCSDAFQTLHCVSI